MYQAKKNSKGILACLLVAILSWIIGRVVPYIGSAVVALVLGMLLAGVIKDNKSIERGVKYTARNVIQWAVILLGFGLNLTNIIHI